MTPRPAVFATFLLAAAALAGCTSSGTVGTAPAAGGDSGPVQDLTVTGAPTLHWTASVGPLGPLAPPPPTGPVTGCYSWAAPGTREPMWAVRITGASGGHPLQLTLVGPGAAILGAHRVFGSVLGQDGDAVLSVDGVASNGVFIDPADEVPSYFTVEGDGTTGLVSVRFAQSAGGPQTYEVRGRWRCA